MALTLSELKHKHIEVFQLLGVWRGSYHTPSLPDIALRWKSYIQLVANMSRATVALWHENHIFFTKFDRVTWDLGVNYRFLHVNAQ